MQRLSALVNKNFQKIQKKYHFIHKKGLVFSFELIIIRYNTS